MNKAAQILIGTVAAGMAQFGFLVSAGVTSALLIAGGVIGAMGATAGAMLKEMPRKEWSDEKREAKQDVTDAKAAVEAVRVSES
jgi:hypothetical protein